MINSELTESSNKHWFVVGDKNDILVTFPFPKCMSCIIIPCNRFSECRNFLLENVNLQENLIQVHSFS